MPQPALRHALKSLFLSLFALSAVLASAQPAGKATTFTLTGQVVDSLSGKGIEYATVSLTAPDTTLVLAAAAADGTGRFSIEVRRSGTLRATFTSPGYVSVVQNITIDPAVRKSDLGKIALAQGVDLQAVVVTAQRPLVVVDAEKLTYSVEADPDAPTSTVSEIMRKVPQLQVDADDNVTLNGQSNYKVLVNGKESPMMSKNFKEVIKSMPASSIKDIQVITNPSTKYEAEGAGGIINIITTKKTTTGYSGRISGGISTYGSYEGNAYFSMQAGKLNLSANTTIGNYKFRGVKFLSEREQFDPATHARDSITYAAGRTPAKNDYQNFNIEASYEMDTANLLSLGISLYNGGFRVSPAVTTQTFDGADILHRDYTLYQNHPFAWRGIESNIDYQHTFRKPEHTLTLSYKFSYGPDTQDYDNTVDPRLGWYDYVAKRSNMKEFDRDHTIQFDYYNPITKKHQIETGFKYNLRSSASESYAERKMTVAGEWEDDLADRNDLNYTRQIFGLYGGYLFKLQKFSAKAGFRLETAANDGTVKTNDGDLVFNNRQFNLIPYANLSWQPQKSQNLRISYTQRLSRPGIWRMNPYRNNSDPQSISTGNPDLKASVINSFAANYSFNSTSWNFFTGLTAAFTNNAITDITTLEEETGLYITKPYNAGKQQRYGLNSSCSYRLKTQFSINLSANAGYTILDAPERGLHNEGLQGGGNLNVSTTLWKDADFRTGGGFGTPNITLQGKRSGYYYYWFGLTQKFFKKKLDVSASINNPFTKYRIFYNTVETSRFRDHSEQWIEWRRWNISIGYRFGKTDAQVKKAKRGIKDEGGEEKGGAQGGGGMMQP